MGAVGFIPLFGGPGYEHAIATGLLLPSVVAIVTALDTSRDPTSALDRLGRGVVIGLAYAGISIATSLVHAARIGVCEIWGALLYFFLTAGLGCVMGGAWGALAGGLVTGWKRRRLGAALVGFAGPLACIVVSLYRYWSSPMIFAFDPFVGYFSGSLYDTVIEPGTSLLTYRLGSLATLMAFACIAAAIDERFPASTRLALRILGGITALASLSITFAGTKLNHFHTSESIAKDLGAEKRGARCDVLYPSTTSEQAANLLVKDCDEDVAQVEAALGTVFPDRIKAIFFRDAEDKRRLMGAANVYIAKPWRKEVYLQLNNYPHPVLAHELAHVIAGGFGPGPFKVAGGLLPNPGLVEGIAVFAAPDDEDLTDLQWARAMKEIGILPPMSRVFSLSFLGDASSKSYTLAGAFVSWVAETWGKETVRRWYQGDDITALTKKDWPTLDREFVAALAKVSLPDEAASFAKAKFARPGIFGRKCPHLVDALRREADVCRDSQRFDEAIATYRKVLAKDPQDWASQKDIAVIQRRHRDKAEGRAALERFIADEKKVPRTFRDRAEEALADADFIDGAHEEAAKHYDSLAKRSLDEDMARTYEIKALGARDPAARAALQALLLGDQKHGADLFLGGVELGTWNGKDTPSALASYLIGRNLVTRGFYEAGAKHLDAALAERAPNARVLRETLRQRAIAACALRDRVALDKARSWIEGPDDPFRGASGGRREATLRMIARCAR